MSENLKTLLQQALDMLEEQALHIEAPMLPAGEELLNRIRAAISQQAEPAQAQDERGAKAWPALAGIGRDSGHPRAVVLYLRHEPSDEHLRMIQEALRTRPAQTEQQPVAVPEGWKLVPVQPTAEMLAAVTTSTFEPLRQEAMKMAREDYQAMLYAAPIAQTEQQPLFFINPLVIDELKGKRKPSPGGLTWSRTACGHWTFAVYAAPIAQTAQGAGDASA